MTHAVVDIFRKANKNGYGDRTVSTSLGVASYFGKRGSAQSTKNPVEGPGHAYESQYYRIDNNKHPEYMVAANKILSRMSTVAGKIRKKLDPVMTAVHYTETVEKFNRMKSATFGKKNKTMSFGCAPHADRTDCGTKKEQAAFMADFIESSEKSTGGYDYDARFHYALSFMNTYGIGKSTCVMYQILRNPKTTWEYRRYGRVQQLFVNIGLFTASRITDLSSFIFLRLRFSIVPASPLRCTTMDTFA